MRSTFRRTRRRWRRLRRPALGLACALALAAPGSASAGWDPPREISDADSSPLALSATAGMNAQGNAVVLWHARDGVEAVVRSAGRNFGKPRTIAGSRLSMPDLRPRLAFDPRGAALALWSYFEPHPRFVEDGYAVDYSFGLRIAGRGRTGSFGRAQTLTDRLDADPSADLAFDPSGAAVVVWTDEGGMHAAARPPGKRRFGRAQVISQTQADPQVGVAGRGSAVAAWAADRGDTWTIGAATSDDNRFGKATALKIPGLGKSKPVIGVDARSAVTAAWSDDGRVMAATCRASGRCGKAYAISRSGEKATGPRVAVAPDGTAVVAWRTATGVSAAIRKGHRRFGSPGRLAALEKGQKATALAVGVGADGDAAAVWTVRDEEGERVHAALRRAANRRFARGKALTAVVPGAKWSEPQIVLDASGNALAVWGGMIDGRPAIHATAYNAPAPAERKAEVEPRSQSLQPEEAPTGDVGIRCGPAGCAVPEDG